MPIDTWGIKLKSQQQVAPNPWNIQDILTRKNEGTDYTQPAPTFDSNAAMGRRLNIVDQMGNQQNAANSQAVSIAQQKAQNIKMLAAQNSYKLAQTNQNNQALKSKQDFITLLAKGKASSASSTSTSSGGTDTRSKLINLASTLTKTPYVWGGTTTKGFDCSGLVQYVYGKMGIKLSRTSQQQATQGVRTSINNLKPGDLVAWGSSPATATHIAIYAGNGQIWEAAHAGTTVRTRAISSKESGIMGISIKI